MNQKLDFIFTRRSIRKYLDKDVSDSLVEELLQAAMSAPSAVSKDPWHFIVVRNKTTFARITEYLPNGKMLNDASVGIFVCGDIEKAHDRQESYMLQDLSAAVENILLAANALGLGACWLGIHPRPNRIEGLREVFKLPGNIIPVAGIAIGWPAESHSKRTRYDKSKVHREKW